MGLSHLVSYAKSVCVVVVIVVVVVVISRYLGQIEYDFTDIRTLIMLTYIQTLRCTAIYYICTAIIHYVLWCRLWYIVLPFIVYCLVIYVVYFITYWHLFRSLLGLLYISIFIVTFHLNLLSSALFSSTQWVCGDQRTAVFKSYIFF